MGNVSKYNGNDDSKTEGEYRHFINEFIETANNVSEYVFLNIQSLAGNKRALIDIMHDNRDIFVDTIIWDKGHGAPARAHRVLNCAFEYVHVFGGNGSRSVGTIDFHGNIDNVVHMGGQRNNEYADVHNATFTVEFAAWFISRFAKETVLDSFGGTGTTMIACEQLGRTCYMMELDPLYCDIIIGRWENFTGEKAFKIN